MNGDPLSANLSRSSRRPMRDMPLTRLLPNILTLMALCSGLTAIRFAFDHHWENSIIAIAFAAVFDVLDGRVARMLNSSSRFGAELDSLSDLVSFGVAPALILYQWILMDMPRFGWVAVLVFAVCAALRLARFNTMAEDDAAPRWTKGFFIGVPTPAGAVLALVPLVAFVEFGPAFSCPPVLLGLWVMLVGGLMVSRLPSFALKGWRISPLWVAPLFLFLVVVIAGLATNTWLVLLLCAVLYIIGLPLGWVTYKRLEQKYAKDQGNG